MPAKRYMSEETPDSAARRFAVVGTPSDTVDLAFVTREVHVGTSGTLAVITEDNVEVDLPAFPDGHVFAIRVRRIKATGTTAANIVVLF